MCEDSQLRKVGDSDFQILACVCIRQEKWFNTGKHLLIKYMFDEVFATYMSYLAVITVAVVVVAVVILVAQVTQGLSNDDIGNSGTSVINSADKY